MTITRQLLVTLGVLCVAFPGSFASAQSTSVPPGRDIRRTVPLPRAIRRALISSTRDSTGRPGPNYWQLWTDYKIDVRLDPITSRVTGHERVVIHNNGEAAMNVIVLRLDQNIYLPTAARAKAIPAVTDG